MNPLHHGGAGAGAADRVGTGEISGGADVARVQSLACLPGLV